MSYKEVTFPENSICVVTGGAGFIGSNLCAALLDKGCTVRCMDNLSTGFMENIEMLMTNPQFSFYQEDILSEEKCNEICEKADFVFHEAAWGSVPRSMKMPLYYEEVNIRGTVNMMEAARKNGVKRFVYASSSSVYGDAQELPKREEHTGNALSPYALTKQVDELYGKLYTSIYGLETIGLRYFNVFGRHQNPDGAYAAVIPKFIRLLLADKQPMIHGDGSQSRDFTYIENVIEANMKAALAPKEAVGQAYNIACGARTTLNEVYQLLTAFLHKDIKPSYGPSRAGDIPHSHADIKKAQNMLGYHPEYDFQKGMQETIAWYCEALGGKAYAENS